MNTVWRLYLLVTLVYVEDVKKNLFTKVFLNLGNKLNCKLVR